TWWCASARSSSVCAASPRPTPRRPRAPKPSSSPSTTRRPVRPGARWGMKRRSNMRFITPAAQSRAWIRTYPCGVHATPLQPTTAMLRIEDIAQGLAHECRFNGHVREFYSVAEHCVRVSWLVPQAFALEGLLHDASEAYLKDVPSPLKKQDE